MAQIVDIDSIPQAAVPLVLKNQWLPSHYDVQLDIWPSKRNYNGNVSIELIANEKAKTHEMPFEIVLHSSELISLAASLALDSTSYKLKSKLDAKSQTTTYWTDEITTTDLQKSTTSPLLKIRFLGVVHEIRTFQDVTKGVFKTNYTDPTTGKADMHLISAHCQPHFARTIFPSIDELSWKASLKLQLTIDSTYQAASIMPIETEAADGDKKTVVFGTTPKMSFSAFSFVFGNLDVLEDTANGIPVRVFTQCGESSRAEFALDVAKTYLPLLQSKLGVKYPLPKLDLVSLPFLSDGAVENWSLIQVVNDHILLPSWTVPPEQLDQIKEGIRMVIVHELVHMYVGDYVSFDSYDHTWLNEANATFMANCLTEKDLPDIWSKLVNTDLVKVECDQRLETAQPIFRQNVKADRIDDTFTREAYDKGIFVLRMLATVLGTENYFRMVGDFVDANKFGVFKPVDLWNFMKSHQLNTFKYDVPTIMNSWIRTPGYPVVSVKKDGSKFVVEQHRLLYGKNRGDIEDVPYQIPLLVKTIDGKVVRQMFTDRSLIIDDDSLLFFNAGNTVMANTYYSVECYQTLADHLDVLDSIEQSQLFLDISMLLDEEPSVAVGFIELIKKIDSVDSIDPAAMSTALKILSNVGHAIINVSYFDNQQTYNAIKSFLSETAMRLLPCDNLELENSLLSLGSTPHARQIAKDYFKKLMHGPRESVPAPLLTSILSIVQTTATLKEYKEIHKLIKNPGLAANNVASLKSNEVQTAALNSLGFVTSQELRHKTLNFVSSNLDVAMVELALVGFRFQPDSYEQLWHWYTVQYKVIYPRYARAPSSQQGKFFLQVTQMVFECCLHSEKLTASLQKFIEDTGSVKEVKECLAKATEKATDEKVINTHCEQLIKYL